MTTWNDRIITDPAIAVGKPVVKGTRITVEQVLDLLSSGWTESQILENYPGLGPEDVRACIAYARELVGYERIYPAAS